MNKINYVADNVLQTYVNKTSKGKKRGRRYHNRQEKKYITQIHSKILIQLPLVLNIEKIVVNYDLLFFSAYWLVLKFISLANQTIQLSKVF